MLFGTRAPNTLEDKFPGFKAAFGGEELRRAQAALTCSQVGGTIEAWVATDLPPSLARLSSLSQAAGKVGKTGSRDKGSSMSRSSLEPSAPGSPVLRRTLSIQHDPQQVAVAELNFLAQVYQQELECIGVVQSHAAPQGGSKQHTGQASPVATVVTLGAGSAASQQSASQVSSRLGLQQEQAGTETQSQLFATVAAIDNEAANRLPSLASPPESADGVEVRLADSDVLPGQPPPDSAHDSQQQLESATASIQGDGPATTQGSQQGQQTSAGGVRDEGPSDVKEVDRPHVAPTQRHQQSLETVQSATQTLAQGASATAAATRLELPRDAATRSAAYDAAYGLGLVLQDLAARSRAASAEHLTRLQEACDRYRLAVKLRPSAHSALYNWGVALSDLAQAMKQSDPGSARLCLEAAAARYAQALAINPDMPQALNNWGLVLQELSGLSRTKQERDLLLRQACTKFRQAIRLRPDFDRACYNLGTVCYGAACMLQGELAAAPQHADAGHASQAAHGFAAASMAEPSAFAHAATVAHDMAAAAAAAAQEAAQQRQTQEAEVRKLFTCAAQYICLAFALQQHRDIYRKSLAAVRSLLRLPFLRVGYLSTPVPTTRGTPEEAWRQDWFVLDASSLRSATGLENSLTAPGSSQGLMAALAAIPTAASPHSIVLPLHSIAHVCRLRDPTLPQGSAFCVTLHGAQLQSGLEVVMVAEDDAAADVWVDMLLLAAHVVQSRATEALADALMPTSTQQQPQQQQAVMRAV